MLPVLLFFLNYNFYAMTVAVLSVVIFYGVVISFSKICSSFLKGFV